MLQILINLPPKYRLNISLTRRRKNLAEKPLLPNLGEIFRVKKGNKLSRYFRMVFENKGVKKLIGTNLTVLLIATSFIPVSADTPQTVEANSIHAPTVLGTQSGIQYPLKNIKITQTYRFYHPGVDFDGVTGDAIYPIMAGKVEITEYSLFGYGKAVTVSHGNNVKSLYAHLSKIEVAEGQEINKETKLGEMGSTGRSFGDHLHLEIHENGRAINPISILSNP